MTAEPIPNRVRAWVADTLPDNDRYICKFEDPNQFPCVQVEDLLLF